MLVHDGGVPEIGSLGPALHEYEPAAVSPPVANATLDTPVPVALVAEEASGFTGRPGVAGARLDGSAWSPRFGLTAVERPDAATAVFRLDDRVAELELTLTLHVDDVLRVTAELRNTGSSPYVVHRLAPSIAMPTHCTDVMTFGGRWCREFQPRRTSFEGSILVENRTGRTSHAQLPALFAGSSGFSERSGEVWGAQLAWSGNYTIAAEHLPDGHRHVQLAELLAPGEVELAPGDSYAAPDVLVAWSDRGLSGASQAFHAHARRHLPSSGPRPVILNTWEAVYFDHRLDTLQQLADVAADVGVERFVLDDGWFGGRRDDTAGLGDWWVSDAVWPSGLAPIVDHVRSLGMEFGLWVEPEMVNPDSDLYRAHPEWTLTTTGYEPVLGRQQLVLDLGRPEVRDFLFGAFDALLREYEIAYLKWDMNRDIVQGSRHGRAGTHGHVLGVYELIDRLRAAHPQLEIESCASGGGRADLGILGRTDRIWTSDCNDALERQLIQRGFSMLFPPEVMGAHIGPERAHTTGRRQDLGFRAATALFGHLGVEWNLLDADADQRKQVAAAIDLHKRLRPLLHGGRVVRVSHPDPAAIVHGVVDDTASHALFAYVQLGPSAATLPAPARFDGLDPARRYSVAVLGDLDSAKEFGRRRPQWMSEEVVISGDQLMRRGLQPPVLHPESVLLFELRDAA
ncbi:MAG: alpha-galactosidase [Ilumatobacter sp.]|uniref:alpha-galactosidase n=1 Tax=Ilumatobacter sp. TaxID=1967498 RepID=UPI002630AC7D|nr:alpha-galactosidase [Ilumatobacter sp.]MDJ0769878.1 alpha-galactosidase [Ilumatobacter sp.]